MKMFYFRILSTVSLRQARLVLSMFKYVPAPLKGIPRATLTEQAVSNFD